MRTKLLWGILSLIALPAHGMGTSVDSPESKIECEFLLTNREEASRIVQWLREMAGSVRSPAEVFADYSPKPLAFQEIGLPLQPPPNVKMRIDVSQAEEDIFWLKLYGAEGEIKSYGMKIPPVAVWKLVMQEENESQLDLSLKTEKKNELTVGMVTAQNKARLFISFSAAHQGFVTVRIGLDVDCQRQAEYTHAADSELVLPPEGHVPNLLCRIGVIKAHFKI